MLNDAAQLRWQWGATLAVGLGALVLQAILARMLGPSAFGVFSLATTVAVLLYAVQGGGYRVLLLREGVRKTPGFPVKLDMFADANGHVLCTSVVLVVVCLIVGGASQSALTIPVALALLANAPRIVANLYSADMLSRGHLMAEAQWQMTSRLLPFVATATVALLGGGPTSVLLMLFVSQAAVLGMLPGHSNPLRVRVGFAPLVVRASAAIICIDLVTQLYVRQSMVVLYLLDVVPVDIGRYSLLMRLLDAYLMLLGPLSVLFHNQFRMAGLWADRTIKMARDIMLGAFALVAVAFAAHYLAGPDLLAFIFGEDYRGASNLVPWMLLGAVIMVPNLLLGQCIIAANQEWAYTGIALLVAMVNLVLTIYFVKQSGVVGAAMAMVLTEMALLVAFAWRVFLK